ncbi:transcription termination factor 5, mitochondrial isoform X2 [Colletes gigas]|uniref:transcription termination factor 5, mitochondrial isoform X2 n=1 Tax=Colletes gigas TaxID=935657 RepID=UPI001C9A54C0|nr:transcription termination factor 5, mitochondrial isoform X2 [Colletes gigas]
MYKLLFPQKTSRTRCGTSVISFSTQVNIRNVLSTYLNYDRTTIDNILQTQKDIYTISDKQLITNCKLLQELKVQVNETTYLPKCLKLGSPIIKNRILLLEEIGVKNINLKYIYNFPRTIQKSIKTFKRIHNILPDEDVLMNIFPVIGIDQEEYNKSMVKRLTLTCDYYLNLMMYYKSHYLKIKSRSSSTIGGCGLRKFVSFKQMAKLVNILRNDLEIDNTFLQKHPYLLNLCPDRLNELIAALKDVTVHDVHVNQIIKLYPRILRSKEDNVEDLLALLAERNISTNSLASLSVLKMRKDVFLQRYHSLKNTPELSVWIRYPTNITIHVILSRKKYFMKFLNGYIHIKTRRNYLRYLIHKELGVNNDYLIRYLTRHPYWKHISLSCIEKTLQYLMMRYSIRDICENIHIILYPRDAVAKTLQSLYDEHKSESEYNSSQHLSLCLYKLEKHHHFTGDGIWEITSENVLRPFSGSTWCNFWMKKDEKKMEEDEKRRVEKRLKEKGRG